MQICVGVMGDSGNSGAAGGLTGVLKGGEGCRWGVDRGRERDKRTDHTEGKLIKNHSPPPFLCKSR